jgi:hypothetical protein
MRKQPRPTAYRAPSWSWASVDSSVIIDESVSRQGGLLKVLELDAQSGDDPVG